MRSPFRPFRCARGRLHRRLSTPCVIRNLEALFNRKRRNFNSHGPSHPQPPHEEEEEFSDLMPVDEGIFDLDLSAHEENQQPTLLDFDQHKNNASADMDELAAPGFILPNRTYQPNSTNTSYPVSPPKPPPSPTSTLSSLTTASPPPTPPLSASTILTLLNESARGYPYASRPRSAVLLMAKHDKVYIPYADNDNVRGWAWFERDPRAGRKSESQVYGEHPLRETYGVGEVDEKRMPGGKSLGEEMDGVVQGGSMYVSGSGFDWSEEEEEKGDDGWFVEAVRASSPGKDVTMGCELDKEDGSVSDRADTFISSTTQLFVPPSAESTLCCERPLSNNSIDNNNLPPPAQRAQFLSAEAPSNSYPFTFTNQHEPSFLTAAIQFATSKHTNPLPTHYSPLPDNTSTNPPPPTMSSTSSEHIPYDTDPPSPNPSVHTLLVPNTPPTNTNPNRNPPPPFRTSLLTSLQTSTTLLNSLRARLEIHRADEIRYIALTNQARADRDTAAFLQQKAEKEKAFWRGVVLLGVVVVVGVLGLIVLGGGAQSEEEREYVRRVRGELFR